MPITQDVFGTAKGGQIINRYTLTNNKNISVQVIDLACSITSIRVPDRNGVFTDITPGYDNVADYEVENPYYGAIIGRVANRIGGGRFKLDGIEYKLNLNDPPNHNHGGTKGWHKLPFQGSVVGDKVVLKLISPDGDENYPGEVTCTVTYSLTEEELVVDVHATTTKATPINLASHPYFNLSGHDTPTVYDQLVTIYSEKYAPKNETNVPTGNLANVEGTLFDLHSPTRLGERIHMIPGDANTVGYDHTFSVAENYERKHMAKMEDPLSGRVVDVYSTHPAVHIYTANFIDNVHGKEGVVYNQHSGVALEAQNFPDAINKPNFPSPVLRPGEEYKHTTWFKFSVA